MLPESLYRFRLECRSLSKEDRYVDENQYPEVKFWYTSSCNLWKMTATWCDSESTGGSTLHQYLHCEHEISKLLRRAMDWSKLSDVNFAFKLVQWWHWENLCQIVLDIQVWISARLKLCPPHLFAFPVQGPAIHTVEVVAKVSQVLQVVGKGEIESLFLIPEIILPNNTPRRPSQWKRHHAACMAFTNVHVICHE